MTALFLRSKFCLSVVLVILFLGNFESFAYGAKHIVLETAEEIYKEAQKLQINSPFFSKMYKNVLESYELLEAQNKPLSGTFDDFKFTRLEKKYLDFLVLRYCKTHANALIFIAYPFAYKYDKQIQLTLNKEKYGKVLYSEEISFTKNGAINLLYETYEAADKILNIYPPKRLREIDREIRTKADHAFYRYNSPLKFYVVTSTREKLTNAKREVRNYTGGADKAVHSTDRHHEVIEVASLLLNDNSIHRINHMKRQNLPKFNCYVPRFAEALKLANVDSEHVCFEHGIVLAAYGLRDSGDIDYISLSNLKKLPQCKNLDYHNGRYSKSFIDNVIADPSNHFYYKGLKFCSLKVLRQLKAGTRDQQLIDSVL